MPGQIVEIAHQALTRLGLLAGGLLLAYGLGRFFLYLLQRYFHSKNLLPDSFKMQKHFGASFFLFLYCLILRMGLLAALDLPPVIAGRIAVSIDCLTIVFAAWLLARSLKLAKVTLYSQINIQRADNLRQRKLQTQIQFIEKFIMIFINIVALSLILMNFEAVRKVGTSLIASAGLLGIIVGFAAQKSLGNLLAGFQIAFTQPIRIDDVVIVEGEWGRIEEINLTYVVVRIWDKRALIVPITYFVEKAFQNWTRTSADLIGVVFFHLDYRFALAPLREEFQNFLRSCPLWDNKISVVQVTDFTELTMEVRLLMGARDAAEAFDMRCMAREHLMDFLKEKYPESLPRHRISGPGISEGTERALRGPADYLSMSDIRSR